MSLVCTFLSDECGQVESGGAVIYVIVLGLFLSIAAAMGSEDGPRQLAGHAGPTLEIDIRSWVQDTFGAPLPQVGPLSRGN